MQRWYVRDMRASTMRSLGWTGPSVDQILITDRDGEGIIECEGHNCIVARIRFDNRTDELTDANMADAVLMAAAPELYEYVNSAARNGCKEAQKIVERIEDQTPEPFCS